MFGGWYIVGNRKHVVSCIVGPVVDRAALTALVEPATKQAKQIYGTEPGDTYGIAYVATDKLVYGACNASFWLPYNDKALQ